MRAIGVILAVISCIPMVAMLPAGLAAVFSLIRVTATPWAEPFIPIAPYLFVLSMLLLVVGHARCGWQPASLAFVGGLFVFLAMYVLVFPSQPNGGSMAEMTSTNMTQPAMVNQTNAPLFYSGLVLIVGSFGLVWIRHRRQICQGVPHVGR